ncbi:pyrroloquinoline quinone biosynthesis protein D [Novimethylophilus kurashikiensis]|uniref:PqqA binding protein n=1 Tax=Novimethylophilus kurashikiensis TaxID=1825523 RepID=A0A2R5F798_9PROT|nr:pyrroloquinoline quinone biosynthesis peptide chaperone PqqD [Novimethylophilus kurashikiensis]GBG12783.1 pyrroloquinoline quinone biosynthesis protein D [Novimethylophilus kurashikiensis]
MSDKIKSDDVFGLARHYRFQWEEAQGCYVLLFPEGMIKLNGGAGEVIKRLDGKKNVAAVVDELKTAFPEAPDLEADVVAMIELAADKAWIERKST